MKICPKCNIEHERKGTFCSRKCANSRTFSEESKQKKSNANKGKVGWLRGLTLNDARVKKIVENKKKKHEEKTKTADFNTLSENQKRKRILIEQDYRCSECGIEQMWNCKPLKFELDHISGIRKDNTRNNLRMVCPNCHSQTPTYKTTKTTLKKYSDEEIIQALTLCNSGYKAMKHIGMNPHGGNYVRLRNIIKKYNLSLSYTV